MPSQGTLDYHFIKIAWITALNLSKDPSTKVGAVIVTPDSRQISLGYNGMPCGIEETLEIWDRPIKYEYVIHAELNARLNCPFDTEGCTMYVTHRPCHRCLGIIRNARIARLVFNDEYNKPVQNMEVWNNIAKLIPDIKQINDDEALKLIKKIN